MCPILILKKFSDTQDLSLKIFSDIKRNYLSTYLKKKPPHTMPQCSSKFTLQRDIQMYSNIHFFLQSIKYITRHARIVQCTNGDEKKKNVLYFYLQFDTAFKHFIDHVNIWTRRQLVPCSLHLRYNTMKSFFYQEIVLFV